MNNQLHMLPVQSLEEYYAGQYRKTSVEVDDLGRHVGMKREVARHVGRNITQAELEQEMPALMAALDQCWSSAYS